MTRFQYSAFNFATAKLSSDLNFNDPTFVQVLAVWLISQYELFQTYRNVFQILIIF